MVCCFSCNRVKASFSEHPVVLPLMTPHSGERKGANVRACYTLQSLDSRWKIAVPRLGPAIIATRRHTPGPSAADVDVAFTTPSSLRPARRVPPPPVSSLPDRLLGIRNPPSTISSSTPIPHPPLPSLVHPATGDPSSSLLLSPETDPADFTFVLCAQFGERDKSSGRIATFFPAFESSRAEPRRKSPVKNFPTRNFCYPVESPQFFRRTSFHRVNRPRLSRSRKDFTGMKERSSRARARARGELQRLLMKYCSSERQVKRRYKEFDAEKGFR